MNGEERQRTAAGAVPREFRRELYRITEEQLLPSHVEAIARLRGSYPHSISFVEDGTIGPHGYNCFMYALSLRHLFEAAHPGSDFVVELLDTCYLQEIGHAEARDGSVLIYFEARVPRHAGVFRQDGFVISKWGLGHVWRHPIFEVPSYYGDEVRFFHSLVPAAGTPTKLFEGRYFVGGGFFARTYDVAPDGRRFLIKLGGGGSDETAAPPSLIVVQHWFEELKRLVPTK